MSRSCRMPLQIPIFCGADFGSMIALDIRQKLKPFLHSSQKQMAMSSFPEIYGYATFRSGRFGQGVFWSGDISVHEQLITFVYLNDYIGRRNVTLAGVILLRSESPSGKCAKLRTVAASNNISHAAITLLLFVCTTYIWA